MLATRGARLWSAIIDGLAIAVLLAPVHWWLGSHELLVAACDFIVACAVQVWFFRDGQSLGKRFMQIRIVEYDSGRTASALRILALRILPFALLGPALMLLDALFILGAERRCLHDLLAGTKVVRVGP
jgi:uncharacterized RDD family membrane protein YckC